jgi:hypothetical protein
MDLWPAISPHIGGGAPRSTSAWLLAGSLAALFLGAVIAGFPDPGRAPREDLATLAPIATGAAWRSEVERANDTLRAALDAQPGLDPAVRRIVEDNLGQIDHAIGEIETALRDHPADPLLQGALVGLEQQRFAVLRQLTLSHHPG